MNTERTLFYLACGCVESLYYGTYVRYCQGRCDLGKANQTKVGTHGRTK